MTDVRYDEKRGTKIYRQSVLEHRSYHEYSLEEKEAFAAILNHTLKGDKDCKGDIPIEP